MGPETRYARSGEFSIAYQTLGEGARDIILVQGFATHIEVQWEGEPFTTFCERLGRLGRVIVFDRRGTGLSDPVDDVPTFEERMDDVRAVLDAAGSQRAVLFGVSEGGPMSILFAATYPERTEALILHGAMARSTWAPDYPWATPAEDLMRSAEEFIAPVMYEGGDLDVWVPSLADDPAARAFIGRYRRYAATPKMTARIFQMFLDVDVRDILPTVDVPTLVLHRRGDRVVNRRAGEWLASQIRGARYVELDGRDHFPWIGDQEQEIGHISEFLTGTRLERPITRVLKTVMFTDIVGSTARASALGDARWRELLARHDALVREHVEAAGGTVIKSLGDGIMATFDGPARAVRCGLGLAEGIRAMDLDVRVGLHTGECELIGDDVGGMAVHVAARIGALAAAGEVLTSRTVKDLVLGSGLVFDERGTHELKGVPERWPLYAAGETS